MSMQETRDFATSLLTAPELTARRIAMAAQIINTLCDVIETRAPEAKRTPEQTMQLIELINWHESQCTQRPGGGIVFLDGIHGRAAMLLRELL